MGVKSAFCKFHARFGGAHLGREICSCKFHARFGLPFPTEYAIMRPIINGYFDAVVNADELMFDGEE